MAESSQRVALITGGSRGIGRGIANVFARAGCALSLLDTNSTRLATTADELRGKAKARAKQREKGIDIFATRDTAEQDPGQTGPAA